MRKNKIFVACDNTNVSKIREIIKKTKIQNLKVGYKFGLEFLNSKNGRKFISKLKNKIINGTKKQSKNRSVENLSNLRDNFLIDLQKLLSKYKV